MNFEAYIDEIIGGGALYLFLTITLTYFAKQKQIGYKRMLILCLLLTPVAGFIAYVLSGPVIRYRISYECPACHFEFDQPSKYCPLCEHKGKFAELNPKQIIDHP